MTQNSTVTNIRFKISDEIVNGFAFDGYLYCLKCQISSSIHSKIRDHTLKDIKKKFEQLNQLAKTSDRNKFFIGKSSKMLELVEFLFNTSFEKNINHPEIQGEILKNKAKIIEKWIDPLLDCLCEALPYHSVPLYLKKYLKIVSKLAYSIKESDSLEDNTQEWEASQSQSKYFTFIYLIYSIRWIFSWEIS